MKNKKIIYLVVIMTVLLVLIGLCFFEMYIKNKNFIRLDYSEIIEKVENGDTFVLCVSASECSHCNQYKPKLKNVSYKYDVKIYYTDIDRFSDDDYEKFKTEFSFDGSTPITMFIKDGEEKLTSSRIEGNVTTEKIIDNLKKNGFIE